MQGQSKTTYHQQVTYCGKTRCRKCREGIGHGPYWYAYQIVNGQTTRTYIGKHLPPEALATMDVKPTNTGEPAMSGNSSSPIPPIATPSLRVFTLGQFRLERSSLPNSSHTDTDDGTRQALRSPGTGLAQGTAPTVSWQVVTDAAWQQRHDSQVRTLLGYLLSSPQRRAQRSQLLAALWPEEDNETSTRHLNKTMQLLQRILGYGNGHAFSETNKTNSHVGTQPLRLDGDWLILAGQESLWVDANIFDEMLQVSTNRDEALGNKNLENRQEIQDSQQTPQQREQLLQTALVLYNGDFLPEERDAEWILPRRQTLRHAWIAAVLELTDLYTARNALTDAVKILDRLLAKDPTNEAAVQRLMVVLARSMRRIEALRAYQRFENILRSEYRAEPSPQTLELCEALRQGKELPRPERLQQPSGIVGKGLAPFHHQGNKPLPYDTTRKADLAAIWEDSKPLSHDISAETIGRTHQGPLIGREQEMQTLRTLLQEVEQGVRLQLVHQRRASGIPLDTQRYPLCLLLMGEAGIGKTRLAEEMSREAR
jgi:DNA-binding SARP family transcriptional activator